MLIYNINITMFLVFKKQIKFVLFQKFGEKFEISVLQGSLLNFGLKYPEASLQLITFDLIAYFSDHIEMDDWCNHKCDYPRCLCLGMVSPFRKGLFYQL